MLSQCIMYTVYIQGNNVERADRKQEENPHRAEDTVYRHYVPPVTLLLHTLNQAGKVCVYV